MTNDQVRSVLSRVLTWPTERQAGLADLALEIEVEFADGPYHASPDEPDAIDEGLVGEPASEKEVWAAFAGFRRA